MNEQTLDLIILGSIEGAELCRTDRYALWLRTIKPILNVSPGIREELLTKKINYSEKLIRKDARKI